MYLSRVSQRQRTKVWAPRGAQDRLAGTTGGTDRGFRKRSPVGEQLAELGDRSVVKTMGGEIINSNSILMYLLDH